MASGKKGTIFHTKKPEKNGGMVKNRFSQAEGQWKKRNLVIHVKKPEKYK